MVSRVPLDEKETLLAYLDMEERKEEEDRDHKVIAYLRSIIVELRMLGLNVLKIDPTSSKVSAYLDYDSTEIRWVYDGDDEEEDQTPKEVIPRRTSPSEKFGPRREDESEEDYQKRLKLYCDLAKARWGGMVRAGSGDACKVKDGKQIPNPNFDPNQAGGGPGNRRGNRRRRQ